MIRGYKEIAQRFGFTNWRTGKKWVKKLKIPVIIVKEGKRRRVTIPKAVFEMYMAKLAEKAGETKDDAVV